MNMGKRGVKFEQTWNTSLAKVSLGGEARGLSAEMLTGTHSFQLEITQDIVKPGDNNSYTIVN